VPFKSSDGPRSPAGELRSSAEAPDGSWEGVVVGTSAPMVISVSQVGSIGSTMKKVRTASG
jgi:hypothetical protein